MDKALQRRRMVEHELRLALGREEFEVVYQPQFDLATEQQCGSEALIRWHHPVHGKIAPGHFISVAEDTGLIVPIGEWVLRRACTEAATWPEPLTVAVNLSPAQFRDGDIADTVASVLKETGLAPRLRVARQREGRPGRGSAREANNCGTFMGPVMHRHLGAPSLTPAVSQSRRARSHAKSVRWGSRVSLVRRRRAQAFDQTRGSGRVISSGRTQRSNCSSLTRPSLSAACLRLRFSRWAVNAIRAAFS